MPDPAITQSVLAASFGFNAANHGTPLKNNPFRPNGYRWLAWSVGWRIAKRRYLGRPFHVKKSDKKKDPRGRLWHPNEKLVAQALRAKFSGHDLACGLGRSHRSLRKKFWELDQQSSRAGGAATGKQSSAAGRAGAASDGGRPSARQTTAPPALAGR